MACAKKSDKETIVEILKKMSVKNRTGTNAKHPSSDATSLGSDVSLVRNVAVPPIIVFNCLLLF